MFASNFTVPIYIKSNDCEVLKLSKEVLCKNKHSFHVQLSELIALLMGYEVDKSNCNEGYIADRSLTGNNGYMKVIQKDSCMFETYMLYE